MEDVAVVVCPVCVVAHDNLINFDHEDCSHTVCVTCFELVKECPTCKKPKSRNERGKKINVSSLMILRREDVESNFGVTQDMLEAANRVTRRPGDESDEEFIERR